MILKIFTVFDCKAESYLPPFHAGSTGLALRSFADAVNRSDHFFNKHPSDYTLFEIGEFDDQSALYTMLPALLSLGCAIEYLENTGIAPSEEQVELDLSRKGIK